MTRIVIAAIVGGLIVAVWGVLIGIATPLGDMGVSTLPDEARLLDVLRVAVPEPGMYVFPVEELKKQIREVWPWQDVRGPSGVLIITPRQTGGCFAYIALELAGDILAACVAAFLVSWIAGSLTQRAFAVALLAIFGTLSSEMGSFLPTAVVIGQGIIQVVGWFVAGLAIARIVTARALPATP